MRKLTNFEFWARRMEKNHGKPRPSWSHDVETYAGAFKRKVI